MVKKYYTANVKIIIYNETFKLFCDAIQLLVPVSWLLKLAQKSITYNCQISTLFKQFPVIFHEYSNKTDENLHPKKPNVSEVKSFWSIIWISLVPGNLISSD